jgi:Fe-S cluster assembly protein SufB
MEDSQITEVADITSINNDYKYGFRYEESPIFKTEKGLSHEVVDLIADHKSEPDWMREFRHRSLNIFYAKPMPNWGGPSLKELNFDDIYYYLKPVSEQGRTWDDVPNDIKETFERLGIPEAERTVLAGVGAQYESEVVYHSLKKEWEDAGVIFLDTD